MQNITKFLHNIMTKRRKTHFLAVFGRIIRFDIMGVSKESAYLWTTRTHLVAAARAHVARGNLKTKYCKNTRQKDVERHVASAICWRGKGPMNSCNVLLSGVSAANLEGEL